MHQAGVVVFKLRSIFVQQLEVDPKDQDGATKIFHALEKKTDTTDVPTKAGFDTS